MIFRYAYHDGVWIDLENPTEDEVRTIAKEFSIGQRLEMELFSPTPTPVVASDVGVTFLVLHFPTQGEADGDIRDQEVDFVVGNDFVLTVRYEVVAPLHRLQKLLETQALIAPNEKISTSILIEILFAHLFTSVRDHTSHIAERLNRIEHDMFNGLERTTVRHISNISREFLHIEAALANQEGPLSRFLKTLGSAHTLGTSFTERAERILSDRKQVAHVVGTYRAIATEMRETNASLLEVRQNEIMKTLTTITVIVLPLELIAFIFGMHALGTPLEQNPNAFWIILTIMLGVSGVVAILFAKKRWLF